MLEFYVAAYDGGGTNTRVAVARSDGKIIKTVKKNISEISGKDLPNVIGNHLEEVIKETNVNIVAIAGSQAGTIDSEKGIILYSPNVKDGKDIDMKSELTKRFNVPFWLENDANAAAYGVLKEDPNAKGMKNLIYIVMGTGIGGGIIINNEIYRGNGSAGEIGHMIIVPDGRECGCGKKGCWEAYSSGGGISKKINGNTYMINSIREILNMDNEESIGAQHVFEASRKGFSLAKSRVEKICYYNAIAVSNLINILEPDGVFIGEAVAENNPEILQALKDEVPSLLMPGIKEPKILKKEIENPGLCGAIYLAIEGYLRKI